MVQQHDQRQKQKKLFHISIPGKMTEPAETGQAYYTSKTSERKRTGLPYHQQDERAQRAGLHFIRKTGGIAFRR
jgi:hypothetical protein